MSDSLQERVEVRLMANMSAEHRFVLSMMKVRFSDSTEGDLKTCRAVLPRGWTHESLPTAELGQLLDQHGRVRVILFNGQQYTFVKEVLCMYTAELELGTLYDATGRVRAKVLRSGQAEPLYVTPDFDAGRVNSQQYFDALSAARKNARTWLDMRYAGWQHPTAFWGD